jgi:hypothetical protein
LGGELTGWRHTFSPEPANCYETSLLVWNCRGFVTPQGLHDLEARILCSFDSLRLDGFECQSSPDRGYILAEMSDTQIDNDDVDQVKLFQLFVLFGGDTKRTSLVSRVEETRVKSLAHDFNWKGKLNGRKSLDTEEGLAEERASNRVLNYVVADQLQNVFSNLIKELNGDPAFAKAFCTSVDSETEEVRFNTKNLVELAKGVEIVSNVKYRALGDKVAQEADVSGGPQNAAQFSISIYKALQNRFDGIPAVDLTTEVANVLKETQADDATEK